MRMSDTIAEIAGALAKAQGMMSDASKDALNPHFKSKYADLAAVRAVVREPLAVNDLALIQPARLQDGKVEVETMLLHKSGEYIAETLQMPVGKNDAHGVGSAISYARRYGLMSLLGLAADDDDGNAAVAAPPARRGGPQPGLTGLAEPSAINDDESLTIMAAMELSLDLCESRDSLTAWAASNSANKARLAPKHRDAITARFNEKLAQYPKQPPIAEAAE